MTGPVTEWTCPHCGETYDFEGDSVGNAGWWDAHETWGVRRCGEPTPEYRKRTCPVCHGTGNDPGRPTVQGGLGVCSCCDSTGMVNLP